MTTAPLPSTSVSVLEAPFSITRGTELFTIREAQPHELDAISWAAGEAFIDDVMTHYFAGSKKPMTITNDKDIASIRDFDYLAFKACMLGGGRIIIAVPNDTTTKIRIAAAIAWYPPRNRAKISNILRGGILAVIQNWGLVSLSRMSEFEDSTHPVCKRAFKTKAMEFPAPTGTRVRNEQRKYLKEEDAWYLNIVFTSPKYEGLGLLSALMREGYAHIQRTTPGIPIILQSSSEKSRDRYLHLGFELMEHQTILGDKKVTALGITPGDKYQARKQQDELTGILYWNMVNWDPSKSTGGTEQKGEV